MKILHVTDLHYQKSHYDWVFSNRHKYGAVCITGDFLNASSSESVDDLSEQVRWVTAWCNQFETPLFLCSGNHDEIVSSTQSLEELFATDEYDDEGFELDEYPDYRNEMTAWVSEISNSWVTTDAGIRLLDGIRFGCIPYGSDDFMRYSDCDILLYHCPPKGLDVALTQDEDWGCSNIMDAISHGVVSPQWLLSGHVHKPRSHISLLKATQTSNPGAKMGGVAPKFAVIEI